MNEEHSKEVDKKDEGEKRKTLNSTVGNTGNGQIN